MKFRPILDRLLVKRDPPPEQSEGGLFLPQQSQELQVEGEVIAAGPGKVLDNGTFLEMPVKPGQKVLWNRNHGTDLKVEDEEHVVLQIDDLMGVVESV